MTSASPALADDRETDASIEQRAVRKAAWRFIPLLALAYFFNYLDRTSVGFAALTMNRDLGLTATQFGWGAGIMFAGYCLFEVPSNLALYRFGARRWLARIMITWGLMAAATALATGPTSFYAIRLLLGIGEAGFFPGVIFFLAVWFPASYRTRVLAWFTVSTPLSSLIGGPLSTWLLQLTAYLAAGWKWMFIVEGLPACALGFLVLKLLSDSPAHAAWLSDDERAALQRAFERDGAAAGRKKRFGVALRDVRVPARADLVRLHDGVLRDRHLAAADAEGARHVDDADGLAVRGAVLLRDHRAAVVGEARGPARRPGCEPGDRVVHRRGGARRVDALPDARAGPRRHHARADRHDRRPHDLLHAAVALPVRPAAAGGSR